MLGSYSGAELTHMFRWLDWYWAKRRLALQPIEAVPPAVKVRVEKHTAKAEDFPPNTDPYAQMAALWDPYASWCAPHYDQFLAAAERYYGLPIRSVLDLACGTGVVSRQVAQRGGSVVGIDSNPAMLDQARRRTSECNVRYMQADFRNFRLDESFDATVCGGDSLNYVETPEELAQVFDCVRRHLRPGGVFVFDAFDDRFFTIWAGFKRIGQVEGRAFEVYSFYDRERGVSEARVVVGDAVERHRRIPLEEEDVNRAAKEVGMAVAEHFSPNTFLLLKRPLVRQFYVLQTSGAAVPVRPSWWARWAFWRSLPDGTSTRPALPPVTSLA
jgi:SAM-dependent methyltransferase